MRSSPSKLFLSVAFVAGLFLPLASASAENASVELERYLEDRIAQQPKHASNWRLLGQLRLRRQDVSGALDACQMAVELAPDNASCQFDLAQAWLAAKQPARAATHFRLASAFSPESDYGRESAAWLQSRGLANDVADLEPNRFAGTPAAAANAGRRDQKQAFAARIEIGAQHNSNVQLAPISRLIVTPGLSSAQAFIAPQLEYSVPLSSCWSLGLKFDGYFNTNEGALRILNLQDYRPGAFWEWTFAGDTSDVLLRVDYTFALDEFNGSPFGQRHALTTTLSWLRPDSESLLYWTVDYSDFEDDGSTPAITSVDGWTNTLGGSHTVYGDWWFIAQLRGGLDLQSAPLTGADFAYRGLFMYAEAMAPLPRRSSLVFQFGWGYRNYPDFTGSPSRDEILWRGSGELRKALSDNCDLALFFAYDRFASDNIDFDTDRTIVGAMTTFQF